jgi:hypothetical protein
MPEASILELISIIVSAISALLGTAFASETATKLLAKYFKSEIRYISIGGTKYALADAASALGAKPPPPSDAPTVPKIDTARDHLITRLNQASELERRDRILSNVCRWSSRLFTFSQYIVGGALTLSFVKQQFSAQTIGVFGVVVFVASGLNQHFNPSGRAEVAETAAEQFEDLIRETEDKLLAIDLTSDGVNKDPKPILDLIKKTSSEIGRIKAMSKRRNRTKH